MAEKLIETNSDWKNIYLISIFAFVDAFQFSFFVWSFWPYAQQLDSSLSPSFIGFIMGLSGVGEAVFAPFFGYWANKVGRINPPLLASLIISFIGNLLYTSMNLVPLSALDQTAILTVDDYQIFHHNQKANRGTYMAYISSSSADEDRTRSVAICGGGALIGLTAGPAIQAAFTWVGEGWNIYGVHISMFTAPAVLAILINVACMVFLLLCFDDRLDKRTEETSVSISEDVCSDSITSLSQPIMEKSSLNYDLLAVLVCMTTRAARMFVTSNIDSIGSPYSQLMFSFDDTEVLQYNSFIQCGIGFLTTFMLIIYAATDYTKRVSERTNIIGAMFALLFFHLITFAWPFLPGNVNCNNLKIEGISSWCDSLKPVNMYIFYGSYVFIFGLALPCLNNSLQSLYSLVLGKGRQGMMQGINQTVGSVSRILGPIMMSITFTHFGPQATWGIEIAMLSLFLLIWLVTYRRLVPASQRSDKSLPKTLGISDLIVSKA